jgi:hypothetical protein
MDHGKDHRPGTDRSCPTCRLIAYEPGWYASLCALVVIDEASEMPVPA